MNFLINDRLSKIFTKKKKPAMTIPITNVQQFDDYRDNIERLYLKLIDADETNTALKESKDNLTLRNGELQALLESERELRNRQEDIRYKLNDAEREIIKLKQSLNTEISNRNHFRSLVAEQDKMIKELKNKITQDSDGYRSILEARKNEVDHLARQAIRLNDELSKVKTDNCQFTEQTTRLVEEKRKLTEEVEQAHRDYEDKLMQDEHTYKGLREDFAKQGLELTFERKISDLRMEQILVLTDAIRKFKKMPCITWRQQGKLVRGTQAKVDVLQAEIEGLRKDFYRVKPQEPKTFSPSTPKA